MQISYKKFVILLFFGTSVFFSLVCLFLAVLYFKQHSTSNSKTITYQLTKLIPSSNTTTLSIVSMDRNLSPTEFISYSNSNGEYFTVSNFFDTKFRCTGTCRCKKKENSRRSVSVVPKVIQLVVFAVSSVMAVAMARLTFEEECKLAFEAFGGGLCDDSLNEDEVVIENEKCEIDEEMKEEDEESRTYHCKGYCMKNPYLRRKRTQNERDTNTNCRGFETSADIVIHRDELEHPKEKFQKEVLHPFCKELTVYKYAINVRNPIDKENPHVISGKEHLCIGKLKFTMNHFDNVKCVRDI